MESIVKKIQIPDDLDMVALLGEGDSILRALEDGLSAYIVVRGNRISLSGKPADVDVAAQLFSSLIADVSQGYRFSADEVAARCATLSHSAHQDVQHAGQGPVILVTPRGRAIRPKTQGQRKYYQAIKDHTITFCMGPAGTGKTYLAMAEAIGALKRQEISRIVLTRPVVEAGESLGFLPGTLEEKLDPYVRPLWDALFEMVDPVTAETLIAQNQIEIAPLAFMRGRTFNDAFVILDEAQNTTAAQMQMFLTRLGFGSKFVITGDVSQRDTLGESGFINAKRILEDIDDIAFIQLASDDIVRHNLVAKIVQAYQERNNE